jgi:hypothetical protein
MKEATVKEHEMLPIVSNYPINPTGKTEFDVTPFNPCPCCVYQKHTIRLSENEMHHVIENNSCCNTMNTTRDRPYAQLGAVDESMMCGCCCMQQWYVSTDGETMMKGCGLDRNFTRELSEELQHRKVTRGNIQLIRNYEMLGEKLDEFTSVMDAILNTKVKAGTPEAMEILRSVPKQNVTRFEKKEVDATFNIQDGCCGWLALFGWYKVTLRLEEEEIVRQELALCYQSNERRPYAQLGSVSEFDHTSEVACLPPCCGCRKIGGHGVAIDAWNVIPGWGFEQAKVKELFDDLNARKIERGNIAQFQRSERVIHACELLKKKLEWLAKDAKVEIPKF